MTTPQTTVFVPKLTAIKSTWLNQVNDAVFNSANATQWGVVADGTTDNTASMQAAITALCAQNFPVAASGRPTLFLPPGVISTAGLTVTGRLAIIGQGSGATFVVLRAGVTDPLFTNPAVNVAGTSLDDANQAEFSRMTLFGNRVDSVTTGTSHGIYCPDTSWSINTQYSSAIRANDLCIYNFTGSGLYFGVNRNWALLNGVISRYNNDNGMYSDGYDHRVEACDFGVNKNYGVRLDAGGACVFIGCNFYVNIINVVINNFVNSYVDFEACAFDNAFQNGLAVSAPTCSVKVSGGRFNGNSVSAGNTYSDILVSGVYNTTHLLVQHVDFYFSVQPSKYLVEISGNPNITFEDNYYDHTGANVPYGTGLSNIPAMLFSSDSMFVNVMKYGAVGDGTTDDSVAWNLATAAVAGTGRTVWGPNATYALANPIILNNCMLETDRALFKAVAGFPSGSDMFVIQGSTAATVTGIKNIQIDMNSLGRRAVAVQSAAGGCDHARFEDILVQRCTESSFSMEPSGNSCWIQNLTWINCKSLGSGAEGWRVKVPATFTGIFVNNITYINCETRGAAHSVASSGDFYLELANSALATKAATHTFINWEADAAFNGTTSANHGQYSFRVVLSGTNCAFENWVFLNAVIEDTATVPVITGFPTVWNVTGTPTVAVGHDFTGLDGNRYGQWADPTKIPYTGRGSNGRNVLLPYGYITTTYANDAAAAASGLVAIGGPYLNAGSSSLQIRRS